MNSDPERAPQFIDFFRGQISKVHTNCIEAVTGCQSIAILHSPQLADRSPQSRAQRHSDIGEAIELPRVRLTLLAFYRRKVIPVDGRGPGSDRTCRALRTITLVACDAGFRRDFRAGHFKEIELGRHLEQRARIFRRLMHSADIASDDADLEAPRRSGCIGHLIPEGMQGGELELSGLVTSAIDERAQSGPLDRESRARCLVSDFLESRKSFKPIHDCLPRNAADPENPVPLPTNGVGQVVSARKGQLSVIKTIRPIDSVVNTRSDMFQYSHPHPAVATDIAIFTLREGRLSLLLIKRRDDPFKGRWALPGGFLKMDEDLDACARRELREETNVDAGFLAHFANFSAPKRDPRERVISVAYLALVNSTAVVLKAATDASDARWWPVDELPSRLAFDHAQIIGEALKALRSHAEGLEILFALLPEKFTLSEFQAVYEAVAGKPADKRNFRKKVQTSGLVTETDEFETGNFRPARLYKRSVQ